jgi:hypothetical protein
MDTKDTITIPYDEYIRLRKEDVLVTQLVRDLSIITSLEDMSSALVSFIDDIRNLGSA